MWFFKKRDDSYKWHHLHKTLSKSFDHIKFDVSNINKKIIESHETHKAHKKDILILNKRLSRVESLIEELILDYSNSKKQTQVIRTESFDTDDDSINLTNLQKSILLNLSILKNESGKDFISMKDLAQELYPNKNYTKIKSLLSAYTDLLVDLKFIKKEKKGKETYLSLTYKADKHLRKVKIKKEA